MTPVIQREIAGRLRAFKFTFKTMHVLLDKFPTFDVLSPFEQLPAFVYAGLLVGNSPELDTLSFDEFEENWLYTMTPEDAADVMDTAKQAMGFLGVALNRLNPPEPPAKSKKLKPSL